MFHVLMASILLIAGLAFTVLTRGFQFRFKTMLKSVLGSLFKKQKREPGTLTPFETLATALAGSVGTGNIAGVAGALIIGGPGAIFWMWISALFGMATKFAEIVLALSYRTRTENGTYVGSTMNVIVNGLGRGKTWLAQSFAMLGIVASLASGNMVQVNTIAASVNEATGSPSGLIVGIVCAALTLLVMIGGIESIGRVTSFLVPFMSILYIGAALFIIIPNAYLLPQALSSIIRGAFGDVNAAIGGVAGFTMINAFKTGTMRGVFSHEAGMGSAPMAYASSPKNTNPVEQGMSGIFEVFFDTIVICSLTAFMLMVSPIAIPYGGDEALGMNTVAASLSTVMEPRFASVFLAVCVALFAYASIIGWSLYGMRCADYLFNKGGQIAYRTIFILCLVVGAVMDVSLVWQLGETANGAMAIPNLIALLALAPVVKKKALCYSELYGKQNKRKHKGHKGYRAGADGLALRHEGRGR